MEFDLDDLQLFKIIVLGNEEVGKSSIWKRLNIQEFYEDYTPTVGADFISKKIEYDGSSNYLQIWDTAGQQCSMSLSL